VRKAFNLLVAVGPGISGERLQVLDRQAQQLLDYSARAEGCLEIGKLPPLLVFKG